jgi:hypothetical protein
LAQRILQHDVVHRVPERHGHLLAAELAEIGDVGVTADYQAGAVGVGPGHQLDRDLVVVAHPDRDRLEEVHQVELAGDEALDQRRPAADQRRALGLQAFLLEVAHAVGDQQGGGVGDRQIADAHDLVVGRCEGRRTHGADQRAEGGHQAAGRKHVECLAAGEIGGEILVVPILGTGFCCHFVGHCSGLPCWH